MLNGGNAPRIRVNDWLPPPRPHPQIDNWQSPIIINRIIASTPNRNPQHFIPSEERNSIRKKVHNA
jgi:hypothetical protein